MSYFGIEWMFRLIREPQRLWKRYLVEGPPFFKLVIKQRMGYYSNPWHEEDFTWVEVKKSG
jgi:UDP-N-acetyl-D-mannosaminuronic acid transferase (WecB/TagA/CpsF family)